LERKSDELILTMELANIIRRCWQTDVAQRPSMGRVAKELIQQKEVLFYRESDEIEDSQHLLNTKY